MLVGHGRVVVVIAVVLMHANATVCHPPTSGRSFYPPPRTICLSDHMWPMRSVARTATGSTHPTPRSTGSRVPPDDASGSASRGVADIEPDGMSAPPRAAREQPTRHSPAVRLEPSASDETPAHVPTARPSCQDPSAESQSGQPQPGRPHGQTAAPSKPSVIIPEVSPEARPDAELAAELAARLDGTAASRSSEEPTKPRATYSPEQLRLLQVRGSRGNVG